MFFLATAIINYDLKFNQSQVDDLSNRLKSDCNGCDVKHLTTLGIFIIKGNRATGVGATVNLENKEGIRAYDDMYIPPPSDKVEGKER